MTRIINGVELDAFTYAYAMCALWASSDENDKPLDDGRDTSDIHPDALRKMVEECRDFRALTWGLSGTAKRTVSEWLSLISRNRTKRGLDGIEYTTDESDGHDFWLTRNHHGAGFWDRGYGAIGEIVTEASHSFGEVYLYVGDDGKIHQG